MLKNHVTERHPDQQFTFLCTADQSKEERLRDMLNRSITNIANEQLLNLTHSSTSITAPSLAESVSPFIISLSASPHPQPKEDILILEESEKRPSSGGMERLAQSTEQHSDQVDVKQNFTDAGDYRCATCQQSVPRNLVLIRDHVKLHFKEKTGCVPADLTKLLPNLQQIYCQLLMNSFPPVGASVLDDDIPGCNKETNQDKMDANRSAQDNNMMAFTVESTEATCSISHQLAQISALDQRNPFDEASSSTMLACDVCAKTFPSMLKMRLHRAGKHGINARYHCKPCKLYISSAGGLVWPHLLHVHLHKFKYECSLCGNCLTRSTIKNHDPQFHG